MRIDTIEGVAWEGDPIDVDSLMKLFNTCFDDVISHLLIENMSLIVGIMNTLVSLHTKTQLQKGDFPK